MCVCAKIPSAMKLSSLKCDALEIIAEACPDSEEAPKLRGRNLLLELAALPAPFPAPAPATTSAFTRPTAPAPSGYYYDPLFPTTLADGQPETTKTTTKTQKTTTVTLPQKDPCLGAFNTFCKNTYGKTCSNCVLANGS